MKRILVLALSAALVAGALLAVPAAAQEAPVVPENPNVVDPASDANFGAAPASFNGADILAGWFTHDATTISAHVQTTNAARPESMLIDVGFDPGVGAACMYIDAVTEGAANDARVELYYEDDCGDQGVVPVEDGTFTITEGPDGTAINTITVPRSADPAFGDGKTLATPFVNVWNNAADAAPIGVYDTTDPGTDYTITSPDDGKPGKNDPPGKKKGCDKGKGKKRGCEGKGKKAPKKGKPAKSCTPIVPSTSGAEAPHVTLTDAHTAEAPLVQTVELEQRFDEGLTGANPSSVNVTVDTAGKEVGLYATLEFPERRDYDLWAYFPGTEDEEAASSHGFNPLIETQGLPGPADQSNTATNHGGETTASSENLVGILTPDCGGYTVSAYNYFGEGGELELKLWLGEVSYDPAETGGGRAVASIYDSMQTFM